MHTLKISTGAAVLFCLSVQPAFAQRGQSASHVPSPAATTPHSATPTTHGPSTTSHGPSATTHGPSTTAKGGAAATHGSSPTTHSAPTTHAPSTHGAGAVSTTKHSSAPATSTTKLTKKSSSTTTTTLSGSTTGTTSHVSTTAINFTSTPVGQKLLANNALRSKVQTRLQALGYDGTVYQAAYGFKNLGQLVAATNISRNLGIPFDQLKLQMTGLSIAPDGTVLKANLGPGGSVTMVDPALATTPAPTKSLGQSIQTLKAGVDATAAAATATTQADALIQSTSTTSGATTTSTATK